MRRSRQPIKTLRAFGMVDAIVGLLILTAVSLSLANAFVSIGQWDTLEKARIDKLAASMDAESHALWY